MKIQTILKYFSYTIFSNGLNLLISSFVVFIIPKLVGVEEYSYWQLYTFFMTYVGVLHFGWIDGIYLKHGGIEFNSLNKDLFQKEFMGLFVVQFFFGFLTFALALILFSSDVSKRDVLLFVSLGITINNLRMFFIYVLQMTTEIKKYSVIVIFDRILYLLIILLVIFFGVKDFRAYIVCDLIAKLCSLVLAFIFCYKLIFHPFITKKLFLSNIINDIAVGSKLLLANIASNLIVGIVRYGIQNKFGVVSFGKISLVLSISNFIMTFVNAISLVLFPLLRRINRQNLRSVFEDIRTVITILLLFLLILYYPFMAILPKWLPQYHQSFQYMQFLIPMAIFDSKFELLSNTIMKTLRLEKALLKFNIFFVSISLLGTFFLKAFNLDISYYMYLIVFVLASRSIMSIIFLSNKLKVPFFSDLVQEVFIVSVFLFLNYFINSLLYAFILFSILYVVFFVINLSKMMKAFISIKMNI